MTANSDPQPIADHSKFPVLRKENRSGSRKHHERHCFWVGAIPRQEEVPFPSTYRRGAQRPCAHAVLVVEENGMVLVAAQEVSY